jgi:hypothetical protein
MELQHRARAPRRKGTELVAQSTTQRLSKTATTKMKKTLPVIVKALICQQFVLSAAGKGNLETN